MPAEKIILIKNKDLNQDGTIPEILLQNTSAEHINLSNCKNLVEIKEEQLNNFKNLKTLNLFGCENLTSLPSSLASLKSLNFLILSCCKKLTTIPELPKKLEEIILFNCKSLRIDDDLMEKIEDFECSADEHLLGKIEEFKKIQEVNGGAVAPATHPRDPQSSERSREALLS